MVEFAFIASSLIMGVFLVAVFVALSQRRGWRSTLSGDDAETTIYSQLVGWVHDRGQDPEMWTLAFVLSTIGLGIGVLFYVGDGLASDAGQAIAGMAIAGLLSVMLCLFLFFGAYITAKSKGHSTAWGVAEGIMALGLVFILAIVLTLVTG